MDFRVVGNGHRQSLHLYMALAGDSVEELVKPREKSGHTIMWYVVLDVILLSGRIIKTDKIEK